MRFGVSYAIASAAMLIAQPCAAAPDLSDSRSAERQTGAFAGALLKLDLGSKARSVPTARLQLGMTQRYQSFGARVPSRSSTVSAFELGLAASGRPMLLLGGRDTAALKRRLGVNGSTETTLLIAGGVALALVAVLLITSNGSNAEPCIPGNC